MSDAITLRVVMRQEAQRQRQKARAEMARARAAVAMAPQCPCAICQARRSGTVVSLTEIIRNAVEEVPVQAAIDPGKRTH